MKIINKNMNGRAIEVILFYFSEFSYFNLMHSDSFKNIKYFKRKHTGISMFFYFIYRQ
jgi:Na+/citrate or Na+/malate symporter